MVNADVWLTKYQVLVAEKKYNGAIDAPPLLGVGFCLVGEATDTTKTLDARN